jgi:hypothetical protein
MCEKYEDVVTKSLVELKGFILMLKVIPDLLLQAVYEEVLLACSKKPVAILQSHAQVFMHEAPGNMIGQLGLEEGVAGENPCKLLNIFLKEGLGVLWPWHKYCKILLLKTDSIGIEEWKDCTFHLDYSGDMLEKIAEEVPSKCPLFMIMPSAEGGAKIDIGYHGRKVLKLSQRFRTKSIKKGNVMMVSSVQWHRTARPNGVEEFDDSIQEKRKRLKSVVCSADLRLHICIGPDEQYVNPHEATCCVFCRFEIACMHWSG